jgi:hypothetical protein
MGVDERAEQLTRDRFPELAHRSSAHVRSRQVFLYARGEVIVRDMGRMVRGVARARRGVFLPWTWRRIG